MNSSLTHLNQPNTAWQARNVACVVATLVSEIRLGGRDRGTERTDSSMYFGSFDLNTRLQGCQAKRPEGPGGWQEQKLL